MAHSLFDSLSGNMSTIENQSAIQSILDSQTVTDQSNTQLEDEDVLQCGKCKKQFSNLSLFVGHKQTRCTPLIPRPTLQNATLHNATLQNATLQNATLQNATIIQSLNNSAFTSPAAQQNIRAQLSQQPVPSYNSVSQAPLTQLTQNMVLSDEQMLAFSDLTQTVQNGIIQGNTLHLTPGNAVNNGSFLSPVTQLAPRPSNSVTIFSAVQPTTSLAASSSSAFTSTVSVSNLQPLVQQQQITIATVPEKPQNMHIIKPSPTKAARKSAQASALNGGESDHSAYTDDGKKKLSCTYCGKTFMKNFDLQQHVRSHTGEKPFQCVVCGRAFAQKSNVKKHMATHKVWPSGPSGSNLPIQPPAMLVPVPIEPEPMKKLPEPEDKLEAPPEEKEHVSHIEDKSDEAERMKKDQYKLKVVIDNSYLCQYCPEKFKSYYLLKSHMVKHKSFQVYKCVLSECAETFKDLDAFLEHTGTHNENMTYRCHQCSKLFSTLYELGVHQYTHSLYQNPSKSGPWHYQCNMCMNKYATPEALHHHMSTTSHEYPCPHCQKNFTCERFLRKHLASHGTENQYECNVCKKCFKSEHYLKNHALIHTGEKPFECETCGATFNRKDKLKRHNLIHDSKMKYKCPFKAVSGCTKEFSRPDKLKAHLMTHSCEKPFCCEICGKDFSRKPHYTEHMRGHKNDYPYNCERCKRGFFRPKLFREHKCENANGQLKKKRVFQPRRVKRKPGRPRKIVRNEANKAKSNNLVFLENSKGIYVMDKISQEDKQTDKSESSSIDESVIDGGADGSVENQVEYKSTGVDSGVDDSGKMVDEMATVDSGGDKEIVKDNEVVVLNEESESIDGETQSAVKKPKPECYVKLSPALVPVSMVERYVTVQLTSANGMQLTTANSGDHTDLQTQLIPASDINGQIQFAQVPGAHLQISPSSTSHTFHPIQIIDGQPILTVSQGDQLGDLGVGETGVIDIPVDIVTVSNDQAMLCAQEVTNDGDATQQAYSTLVNYGPEHLINTSVEMLAPENM